MAQAIPDGMHSITPHLVCSDAAAAIEFYKKAFNAEELFRLPTPDGKLMHACIRIGDSQVFLVDEFPDMGALGPGKLGGTSVTLHHQVADADAAMAQALAAGGSLMMPLQDMFWGDRYGMLKDPFGHQWSIATHKVDLTPEQIRQALKAMPG